MVTISNTSAAGELSLASAGLTDARGRFGGTLNGGSGADRIFSRGGGADFVNCGSGRDVADADGEDRLKSCERVHVH